MFRVMDSKLNWDIKKIKKAIDQVFQRDIKFHIFCTKIYWIRKEWGSNKNLKLKELLDHLLFSISYRPYPEPSCNLKWQHLYDGIHSSRITSGIASLKIHVHFIITWLFVVASYEMCLFWQEVTSQKLFLTFWYYLGRPPG